MKSVQKFSFAQYWAANIATNVGVLSISQTLVNDGTLGKASWGGTCDVFRIFETEIFSKISPREGPVRFFEFSRLKFFRKFQAANLHCTNIGLIL